MKNFDLFNSVKLLKLTVENKNFLELFKKTKNCFTRTRKMPFYDIIYFIISSGRRSVQYELDEYLSQKGVITISRQGFAKSRENIKPEAIKYLNEQIVAGFEKEDETISTLHNYRLFAVDGSIIDLPENQKLRETFGFSSGSNNKTFCKGKAMLCYDVLNHICPYGELISYFESEKTHMEKISDYFSEISSYKNTIFVLDRGYKSIHLLNYLEKNNQKFVLRVDSNFHKKAIEAPIKEQKVTLKKKSTAVDVRVLKFTLPSGEEEILISNLPDEFTYDEITSIYASRWSVETAFHYIKNGTMLENFTGESETAVLQDFYTSVLLMTFTGIAYREQDDILKNKQTTKYRYKPNTTYLIRYIKVNFIKMLNSNTRITKAFRQLFLYKNIYKYAYAQVDRINSQRPDLKATKRKTHPKSKL